MKLKIQPVPPPPEQKRISFRLPMPTLSYFDAYLDAYAKIYGVAADPDFIANQIFLNFFESDKEFVAIMKSAQAEGSPAPKVTTATTQEKTAGGTG